MKKNNFQQHNLPSDWEPNEFTLEEEQFMGKLLKFAEEIKPEQAFVNQLEMQIIGASQRRNDRKVMMSYTVDSKPKQPRLFAIVAAGIAVLVLIVVSFLTVPSLKAAASEALGFWIKTKDIQTISTPIGIPTVKLEQVPVILGTIEQVMEATQKATPKPTQMEYIIKLPTRLPQGYRINNIEKGQRGNAWVNLSDNAGSILTLQIQPVSQLEGTILGPEDKVIQVKIGDLTGEYVRGGWALNHSISGQMKPEQVEKLIWIDDSSYHKLRWNDGNLNYYLLFAGGRHPGDPDYLGMNDLATIAASMQPVNQTSGSYTEPKSFTPDYGVGEEDIGYITDFQQLEALAGYDIPEPSVIPENYSYIGGEVVMVAPFVDLQYECNDPENYPNSSFGFTLEILKISEKELEWEMEHFGQEEIGESASIETVVINGVTAEYVKGYWNYGSGESSNEKRWDNNIHYHVLKWYQEGFLYTIRTIGLIEPDYRGACMLTKEDLVAYAESLK